MPLFLIPNHCILNFLVIGMKNRAVNQETTVCAEFKHTAVFRVHVNVQERILGLNKLDKPCAYSALLEVGVNKEPRNIVFVGYTDVTDNFAAKPIDKPLAVGKIFGFNLVIVLLPEVVLNKRIGVRGGTKPQVKYFICL